MRSMSSMRVDRSLVLLVSLMSLFTQTYLCATQESDDSSDHSTTTLTPRQRRGRCPPIRDSLRNGWVRMRNRGRIAKFSCIKGFQLIGDRINTCIQGKWAFPIPVCASRSTIKSETTTVNAMIANTVTSGTPTWTTWNTSTISISSTTPTISDSNSSHTWTSNSTDRSISESKTPNSSAVTALTPMFVSSVININEMSTESTSLSADDSKTPITEPTLDNNTPTNATNIIQEVSTLTTTTTPRSDALEAKYSSTDTSLETESTTLLNESVINQSNAFQTQSTQVSSNATQEVTFKVSPTPVTSAPTNHHTITTDALGTASHAINTDVPNVTELDDHNSMNTTDNTSMSLMGSTQSSLTTIEVTEHSSAEQSLPHLTTNSYNITTRSETGHESTHVISSPKDSIRKRLLQNGSMEITTSTVASTDATDQSILNRTRGTTKRSKRPALSSTVRSTTTEAKLSKGFTLVNGVNYRSSYGTTSDKGTTGSTPRNRYVWSTEPLLSSKTAINSSQYEVTTMTPLRRRRQKSSIKPSPAFTASDSHSSESKTTRVLTISVTIISMTILTTTFTLCLIRKLRTDRQNRLSDDSEMLYLSPNEVL